MGFRDMIGVPFPARIPRLGFASLGDVK